MSIKSQPRVAVRLPSSRTKEEEQDEAVAQPRYLEEADVDEYDERKLQKMADDPSDSSGGDGPDS